MKKSLSHILLIYLISLFSLTFIPNLSGDALAPQPSDISFYTPPEPNASLPASSSARPRNIILMIGDGMGLAQVNVARLKSGGPAGRLNMERMPVTGIAITCSANETVTDSAAAATALAAGHKTNNGMVGQLPDATSVKTILEAAKENGLSVGVVVTFSVTHATPACFVAHVASRGEEPEIAQQIIQLRPNIVLGGGKSFFIPSSALGSARKDNRNLLDEARVNGYEFVENSDQLCKAQSDHILGLFAPNHLTTIAPEPSLAEMTEKAIQILSRNKKGFFLMVEGSQIDFASHGNDTTGTIRQALLFDQAIRKAEDFAKTNKKTLVVTTADHETGGLAILNCTLVAPRKVTTAWGTTGHSAVQVPVYAYGPGAIRFTGVHENTDIPTIMGKLLNLKNFPTASSKN